LHLTAKSIEGTHVKRYNLPVTKIEREHPEILEIRCHEISDEVREIVAFVKSRQGQLTGTCDDSL